MSVDPIGAAAPQHADVNPHALLVTKAKEDLDAAISAFFHSRYIPTVARAEACHRSAMVAKAMETLMREIYRAAP